MESIKARKQRESSQSMMAGCAADLADCAAVTAAAATAKCQCSKSAERERERPNALPTKLMNENAARWASGRGRVGET